MPNYSVKVVIEGIDKFTAPIRKVMSSLKQLQNVAAFRNTTAALGNVRSAMGNVGKEAGLLTARIGGLAAVGGFAFKSLFLDSALEFERLSTILNTVERDATKVKKSLAWVSDFASKTPYELSEVTEAFVKMRVYGMNPMDGTLAAIGDMASAMGKSLLQGVEAFADALTGENERLKEFGITAKTVGNKVTYTLGDLHKTVEKGNRLKIVGALRDLVNSRFSGAMIAQSKTLSGLLSNLGDQWTRFSNRVMEGGAFEFIKQELAGFLERLNKMADSGELDRIAKVISVNIIGAFRELKLVIVQAWPVLVQFGTGINAIANALGGYGNLLKVITALMALPLLNSIIMAIVSIVGLGLKIYALATSMEFLWAALGIGIALFEVITAPITLVVAGIIALAGAAFLVYQNWNSISSWFAGMWQKWGGLIRLIFPPIGMVVDAAQLIMQNWGPISGFFQKLWSDIGKAVQNFATNAINFLRPVAAWLTGLLNTALQLAQRLPNNNVFTGQASGGGVPAPGGAGKAPSFANAGKKDTLSIAMKIDSEARPSITNVVKGGSSNIDFNADMGLMFTP